MITTRIKSAPVFFIIIFAFAFFNCANDAGQSNTKDKTAVKTSDSGVIEVNDAEQPAQEPPQPAQADANINTKEKGKKSDVIEIKEKMFIAQTNEIYINANDYFGKTITYEGIFHETVSGGSGKYRYVIRYGPGCCPGDVAAAGFEVEWDKGYPKQNDWVEAVGVLEQYSDNGIPALRLALKSLTVLPTRGKERVTR
jgi:uncharacterized membrane protein YcgQ (UPF0703/DUF1980 family)